MVHMAPWGPGEGPHSFSNWWHNPRCTTGSLSQFRWALSPLGLLFKNLFLSSVSTLNLPGLLGFFSQWLTIPHSWEKQEILFIRCACYNKTVHSNVPIISIDVTGFIIIHMAEDNRTAPCVLCTCCWYCRRILCIQQCYAAPPRPPSRPPRHILVCALTAAFLDGFLSNFVWRCILVKSTQL